MIMKLAYVTPYDSRSLTTTNNWSGTGYYIARSLKNQSIPLEYIGPLNDAIHLKTIRKFKRHYCEIFHNKNYQKNSDPLTLKHYAKQVAKKISGSGADIIFSATIDPIAYLDCKQPIVFWADATFANIQNFYPQYSNLCNDVTDNWHQMEKLALQKCKLAIYSSDWAAESAIRDYGADPAKVKVISFGANVDSPFTSETIGSAIAARPTDLCKLLFLGVDWIRKGGDVAYAVAEKLNQSGLKTELTIVGCDPANSSLPEFVKPLGFISKATAAGQDRISQLLLESHFLILPTLADCTPIVLCEANSLGVPCLSTKVGGLPTTIRNGINGQLFSLDADITDYCDYITNLFTNYQDYKNLALRAFLEYESRLNWEVAGKKIKQSLLEIA
jgi:glycosyltransferase involved in cell wall biosynthesis